jgi:NAD(P)-dependent dehydrogenase (short-subunit alcohol dehydrogenase family)
LASDRTFARTAGYQGKKPDFFMPWPGHHCLETRQGKSGMMLQDKVFIVTGASSGIGAAAAQILAAEGARLVISARRGQRLEDLARRIDPQGGRVTVLAGDVAAPGHAEALVALAQYSFGGLDGAFNNAGQIGSGAPVHEIEDSEWQRLIATNLTAGFLAARAQVPALLARGGGALVFTGSFIGHAATLPGMGGYAAAKAGLIGLVQALAVDYGPQGIRANALLPGGTLTEMAGDAATSPDKAAFIAGLHALKRMARPDEIARTALFLLSDHASFVTGAAIPVDGGNSICKV